MHRRKATEPRGAGELVGRLKRHTGDVSRRELVVEALRRRLPIVHFVVDATFWIVSLPVAVWLRYDYDPARIEWNLLGTIIIAVLLQADAGYAYGLYRRRWRYGSFDEVRVVALTALTAGVVLTVLYWWGAAIPRSVPILATGASILGQITARSVWRLYKEKTNRPQGEHLSRLVIVGAGESADQILKTLRTSASPFLPVAIVDDDPTKRYLRLSGVPVAGSVDQLLEVATRFTADSVLIAVPSADSEFISHVTREAESDGLNVFVLPPVSQLFGNVQVSDIRPVEHADLLGRRPADIDTTLIADYITGRRVLVTGAGGSIGGELCRQLNNFAPAELLMLDRDENGLHATQLSIEGRAMLDDPSLIVADIRDEGRIDEVFELHRPEVVFHAAALKHLPLLELHPEEGWKTNVLGTLNVLTAAGRHGIDRFVNISTDKAANPTSVLGWTKRTTERLTAHQTTLGAMDCVSVRFGNVLGSNGSVLKAFEAQATAGGPITVTHPKVTRYFMTVEEAARLTIYAGAIGDPGEVMILDMGEPVSILEVAERFAHQHDPPLEIVFTGLRPNEKMHEDLMADDEAGARRVHQLISHVVVPPMEPTGAMKEGTVPDPSSWAEIVHTAIAPATQATGT